MMVDKQQNVFQKKITHVWFYDGWFRIQDRSYDKNTIITISLSMSDWENNSQKRNTITVSSFVNMSQVSSFFDVQ